MSDPNSTILDFYPEEFEADMNGKKQEWEAVVKIPFIDESRLLKAMAGAFILLHAALLPCVLADKLLFFDSS
jgi:5'-3' exonuclease